MEAHTLLLFSLGFFALVAAPGPDFVYVFSRSIHQGAKAGIVSALGISTGMLVHTVFAVAGLTALLYTSAIAFLIVKIVGAGYLIYLGVKILLTKQHFKFDRPVTDAERNVIFRQAVLTNVLNPKAGLTFMAYMPQFVSPSAGNISAQVLILGTIICAITLSWYVALGTFSGWLKQHIVDSPRISDVIRYAVGTLLIGLGLRLAWLERR